MNIQGNTIHYRSFKMKECCKEALLIASYAIVGPTISISIMILLNDVIGKGLLALSIFIFIGSIMIGFRDNCLPRAIWGAIRKKTEMDFMTSESYFGRK